MKVYDHLNNKILQEIVDVLNHDGLIIFPTDTVYGIACNAFSESAIQKLYLAKNRSFDNPIGVLTDSINKINLVVDKIDSVEKKLMEKYFPGNLTIIFDKNANVPDLLTANKSTVGVRIPNHQMALNILASYPYPLATTSVNLAGDKEGTSLDDFLDTFRDKVDIVIDGGKTTNIPSTIVRVDKEKINILREGSLKINKANFN